MKEMTGMWSLKMDPARRLGFWTNVCLIVAVVVGLAVVYGHDGNFTCAFAWCGAAVATGGLLGFLFGIPGRSGRQINIDRPRVVSFDNKKQEAVGGVVVLNQEPAAPDVQNSKETTAAGKEEDKNRTASSAPDESNLVQVSDWVTKLLLGGGLTQLQIIPGKVWELSASVAVGMDSGANAKAGLPAYQSFAAGFLIYFFVVGFFGGYFITQLQFRKNITF